MSGQPVADTQRVYLFVFLVCAQKVQKECRKSKLLSNYFLGTFEIPQHCHKFLPKCFKIVIKYIKDYISCSKSFLIKYS